MSEGFSGIVASTVKGREDAMALVDRLFDVAQPSAVYGEPVIAGDYTVITASEAKVGMGVAFGGGAGTAAETVEGEESPKMEEGEVSYGLGGGGGAVGGGVSGSRPVAAISIGPDGVRVEPVVDPTKIALAFFTTLGAMFMILSRMLRASRRLGGQ